MGDRDGAGRDNVRGGRGGVRGGRGGAEGEREGGRGGAEGEREGERGGAEGEREGERGGRQKADGLSDVAVFRSACAHRASYEDPLAGRAGDEVAVGPADVEWPAWRWCTAADGRRGWVPEDLLDGTGARRRLVRDYDACELTVRPGERLQALERLAGWVRCRAEDGREGWVPGGCVKPRVSGP
jgi:hypothetical protein